MNAINRSESFPPHDPWLAGTDVNYYYFGHYLVALLVRVLGLDPTVGFNLAVPLFYALSATAVFAVASALYLALRPTPGRAAPVGGPARTRRGGTGRRAGQPRRLLRAPRVAATALALRLVDALARDRRDGERVPVLQLPAGRPARAHAGRPLHAPGPRLRDPARPRRAATAPQGRRPARGAGRAPARRARPGVALRDQQPRLRHRGRDRRPGPAAVGARWARPGQVVVLGRRVASPLGCALPSLLACLLAHHRRRRHRHGAREFQPLRRGRRADLRRADLDPGDRLRRASGDAVPVPRVERGRGDGCARAAVAVAPRRPGARTRAGRLRALHRVPTRGPACRANASSGC